jgi:uncharacterized repeat protein (TIGR03803 family)
MNKPAPGIASLCLLVFGLTAVPSAQATYAGPNLFGAWASATADHTTNTSGPSEQAPGGPEPNGFHSANASASAGNGDGVGSGQGFANVGLLGGNAAATGCSDGLFQQQCIFGGNYTEFYDTFQITGAPAGTQVSITFTLSTAMNLMGYGSGGWQTRLSDGFYTVENTQVVFEGPYGGNVLQTKSWTATYTVGTSYGIVGWMSMGVSQENCPGGGQNCGVSNTLVMTAVSWKPTAKIAHCSQCRIESASGFNYMQSAQTHAFATLHTFDGADGASPVAGLVQATDGSLYGTTQFGGSAGKGSAFKISRSGALKSLYSFCTQAGCQDGDELAAGLVQGTDGGFYGATQFGGAHDLGTIFKLTRTGALTTLYSFNASGGSIPSSTLTQGTDGKFYGTTSGDGANLAGTVFRISRAGAFKALHNFDPSNGANANWGLIQASDGNFYGTTYSGGAQFAGTVFKIDASGNFTTLYQFCAQPACADGRAPVGGLLEGSDGNLYGATAGGGANDAGTVFAITPGGALTTLHSFNTADGANVSAALIQATDGNLYGTTREGGAHSGGTVFQITPGGGLTTLYDFCTQADCTDGSAPAAPLVQDTDGNLYGTTSSDATGFGTIFRLSLGLSPFVHVQTKSGAIGATVVILGTDLTGATAVSFNGAAATNFTVVSKSEIKATIPAGATTGTLLVTTPGGTLSSNGVFTVN